MQADIERVTSLFHSQDLAAQVTQRDEVPRSYESITDDWLTDVLCGASDGARVVGHRFDERDDGSSNRRRIMLEYNEAGQAAGLPETVFCKAAETLNNRLVTGLSRASLTEANFYNLVRDRIEMEAPTGLYASFDEDNFASLIMLRDLRDEATFCDDRTEVTRELAEQQIRTLAALHSRFYESPELGTEKLPFPTWAKWWSNMMLASPDFADCCDRAFGDCADIMTPELFARRSEIWPATLRSAELHDQMPRTLTHNDVHLKNWYIADNGGMGLSDWQIVSVGHWSRDLIYTITTALTVENRRAWERELVDLYLELMASNGVPREPQEQVWTALRQQLMTALAFWTITLCPAAGMPDMQPLRTTREFLRRLLTAIDDHRSLDAF